MKFFTADTHFYDQRIADFTNRGLAMQSAGATNHDDWLVSIWNRCVSPGDLVYVVGDFSKSTSKEQFAEIMDRLNGTIFLVKGNHDQSATLQHPRLTKWVHRQSMHVNDVPTVLSHEPKIVWTGQHLGSFHLHGHTHGRLSLPGRSLDVGIDSAFVHLGAHRPFTEDEVYHALIQRSPVSYDGRRVRVDT